MSYRLLSATAAALALALSACGGGEGGNEANTAGPAGEGGNQTIAAGMDQNSRFFQAAKAVGLDATLAGPGPYTVLVPSDEAFAKLPDGATERLMQPQSRAELTRVLTYHILPGTVLAEDIGKAIENGNGQAAIATMGGETLTATREGDRILLTDNAGTRATVVRSDEQRANGVVHHVDAVLVPADPAGGGAAQNNSR